MSAVPDIKTAAAPDAKADTGANGPTDPDDIRKRLAALEKTILAGEAALRDAMKQRNKLSRQLLWLDPTVKHTLRAKHQNPLCLSDDTVVTPNLNDPGWNDAVLEARDRGVPIAAFGDTADKIVIHPGHLGYGGFDYFWGHGHWSRESCWFTDSKSSIDEGNGQIDHRVLANRRDTATHANQRLYHIGQLLAGVVRVWMVHPSGNNKGYLSCELRELDPEQSFDHFIKTVSADDCDDWVLFVYRLSVSALASLVENKF